MARHCTCSHAFEYYQNELFCDVVLIADRDGTRIKTHRLVLCPANNYFASLFTSEMQEKDKPEISLKDIAGPILKDLIEYCYTDQIAINQENVYDLMAGASMYQFTRLADEFEKYFRKNIRAQNCLGLWGSARQHAYEVLDELAFDFICEHFTEVLNTDEFLVLGIELLVELLSDDKLEVSSEEDVFNSIKNWLKFDVLGRKMFSESLIETVRMTKISDKFLNENILACCTQFQMPDIYRKACELQKMNGENIRHRHEKFPNFLTIGGSNDSAASIEQYTSKNDSWQKVHTIPTNLKYFRAECIGNQLYLIGGNVSFIPTNKVHCLLLDSQQLVSRAQMLQGRSSFATAFLDNYIYAIGGDGNAHSIEGYGSVERYDMKTNKWTEITPMLVSRYDHSAAVLSGKIYVIGGTKHCIVLNSVECYDPKTNIWTEVASMNTTRSNYGHSIIKNCLYAIGGFNNSGAQSSIERYDEKADLWTLIDVNLPLRTWSFGILSKLIY